MRVASRKQLLCVFLVVVYYHKNIYFPCCPYIYGIYSLQLPPQRTVYEYTYLKAPPPHPPLVIAFSRACSYFSVGRVNENHKGYIYPPPSLNPPPTHEAHCLLKILFAFERNLVILCVVIIHLKPATPAPLTRPAPPWVDVHGGRGELRKLLDDVRTEGIKA